MAAVAGAVLAGISNFYFKMAAVRGYDATVFTFYSGVVSVVVVLFALLIFPVSPIGYGYIAIFVFIGGLFSALANIGKVLALRHIDSTIFFPLFKLLAPAIAIGVGIVWFGERFSAIEWVGMALGLFIPLLLITQDENRRQNNLLTGLMFVLLVSLISAGTATINKFAIDQQVPELAALLYTTIGISIGTIFIVIYRKGFYKLRSTIYQASSWDLFMAASLRSTFITAAVWLGLYAFATGGTLAIVQTIHSMYILIPIILAIIFYKEHWNLQKVVAIILSVAALALLG